MRKLAKSALRCPEGHARKRSATTLVEMLVVMTVASVMVGLAVTTLHLLLGAETESTRAVRYNASLARLARAFREDVHDATTIELPPRDSGQPATLVLVVGPERTVRYELDAHQVRRLENESAGVPHRETYYFPPHSRLSFAREEGSGLVRLDLEIPTRGVVPARGPNLKSAQPRHHVAIEAAPLRGRSVRVVRVPSNVAPQSEE